MKDDNDESNDDYHLDVEIIADNKFKYVID